MLTLRAADRSLMPFRRAMLEDPQTMAYNAPWFPPDGTIPFPEVKWDSWLERWVGKEPERFCGYLFDGDTPVGEVCWHSSGEEIGVVIKAEFRGKGYGAQGMALLAERAFSHAEITQLCNTFESTRDPALALHLHFGFVQDGREDGLLHLTLTRTAYELQQKRGTV